MGRGYGILYQRYNAIGLGGLDEKNNFVDIIFFDIIHLGGCFK